MTEDYIVVDGVTRQFATSGGMTTVLRDVSFRVPRGSFTILFGPSGSGKTTLINLIAGLLEPTSGTVLVNGQNIYELSTKERTKFRARSMGIVHQTNYWMRSLDVLENVAMPLYLSGSRKEPALTVARKSLHQVGMQDFAHTPPFRLSGGQQQQVSLARALVAGTEIILADEPTGNLDSASGQRVMELLSHANHDLGRTIVLITHNLEYLKYGTNHLFIHDGIVSVPEPGKPLPPNIIKSLKIQIEALKLMDNREGPK